MHICTSNIVIHDFLCGSFVCKVILPLVILQRDIAHEKELQSYVTFLARKLQLTTLASVAMMNSQHKHLLSKTTNYKNL